MKKTDQSRAKAPVWARIGGFPFYPTLFALYPVLALTAHNIAQIDLFQAYRLIVVSLLLALGGGACCA